MLDREQLQAFIAFKFYECRFLGTSSLYARLAFEENVRKPFRAKTLVLQISFNLRSKFDRVC